MNDHDRVRTARVPGHARGARVMCAANRVGGRWVCGHWNGHWSVGGSMPSMQDEECDQASVTLHDERLGRESGWGFVYAFRLLYPRALGGYHATRALLIERGYISPYYTRAHETPDQTNTRRRRAFAHRVYVGLPATVPGDARRRKGA